MGMGVALQHNKIAIPAQAGIRLCRVRGTYESYDARTRFQTPACAGVAVILKGF